VETVETQNGGRGGTLSSVSRRSDFAKSRLGRSASFASVAEFTAVLLTATVASPCDEGAVNSPVQTFIIELIIGNCDGADACARVADAHSRCCSPFGGESRPRIRVHSAVWFFLEFLPFLRVAHTGLSAVDFL